MTSVGVNVQQIASMLSQSTTANEVGIAVLKKALDAESAVALGLLQALPPVPQLATEGSVGTRLNAFA